MYITKKSEYRYIVHLPGKWNIILMVIWLSIITFGVVYMTYKYFEYQNELKEIVSKSMNGIIIKIDDNEHGYRYFEVKRNKNEAVKGYDLNVSYFFEQNNIRVNDSVSKPANSRIITFISWKAEFTKFLPIAVQILFISWKAEFIKYVANMR